MLNGSAGPLNGHKAQFLDGGIREPFLLRWPGRLQPGSVYRQPVSTMDLYPTFCAAALAPVPDGTKLDGVNLLPYLTGEKTGTPHEILFWKNGENGAVREGDWKLLVSPWQPKLQLFNLADDIGEKRDLAGEKPELVEHLHKAWLDWSAKLPPRQPGRQQARYGRREAGPGSVRPVCSERQEPRRPPQPRGIPRQPSRLGSRKNSLRQMGFRQGRDPQPRRVHPHGSRGEINTHENAATPDAIRSLAPPVRRRR